MKLYYSDVLSPHKACAVARYLKSPVEFRLSNIRAAVVTVQPWRISDIRTIMNASGRN